MNTEVEVVEASKAPRRGKSEMVAATAGAMTAPADLLRLAVAQGADLDRLERLMALQQQWEANEARKAFTAAMTGFRAEPMQIFKRKEVSFTTRDGDTTSYKHAELSDVTDAVVPAMSKHGLSHRWDVRQEGTTITVDCILTHVQGHSERVTMTAQPDASGKKNPIQQVASTVQYLQRYTLLAATGMSTKSDPNDDDGRRSGGLGIGPDLPPEMVDDAHAAADRGLAVYEQWWTGLTKADRQMAQHEHGAWKQRARDVDAARGANLSHEHDAFRQGMERGR